MISSQHRQLAFATNSDHTEALARASEALAEVSQQLQNERALHAATAEKLRLKAAAHAAVTADARHLKDLATQSRCHPRVLKGIRIDASAQAREAAEHTLQPAAGCSG
jgi:hypothetical protein